MKKSTFRILLCGCILLLGGCAEKAPENLAAAEVTEETLYLRSDGTVQSAYLEDFARDYYREAELKTFMQEMVERYNERSGGEVTLAELTVSGGKASAVLNYDNLERYSDFNRDAGTPEDQKIAETLTSEEAVARFGTESFYQAKNQKGNVSAKEALEGKKRLIVSVEGPIQVKTSGTILYYSAGRLTDATTLAVGEDETAVIVYKK